MHSLIDRFMWIIIRAKADYLLNIWICMYVLKAKFEMFFFYNQQLSNYIKIFPNHYTGYEQH